MRDDENNGGGFGSPPKETQFKPGQSGNPKGRPKGSVNFRNFLSKRLLAVRENGRCLLEMLIADLEDKALAGDEKACAKLLDLASRHDIGPPSEPEDA